MEGKGPPATHPTPTPAAIHPNPTRSHGTAFPRPPHTKRRTPPFGNLERPRVATAHLAAPPVPREVPPRGGRLHASSGSLPQPSPLPDPRSRPGTRGFALPTPTAPSPTPPIFPTPEPRDRTGDPGTGRAAAGWARGDGEGAATARGLTAGLRQLHSGPSGTSGREAPRSQTPEGTPSLAAAAARSIVGLVVLAERSPRPALCGPTCGPGGRVQVPTGHRGAGGRGRGREVRRLPKVWAGARSSPSLPGASASVTADTHVSGRASERRVAGCRLRGAPAPLLALTYVSADVRRPLGAPSAPSSPDPSHHGLPHQSGRTQLSPGLACSPRSVSLLSPASP